MIDVSFQEALRRLTVSYHGYFDSQRGIEYRYEDMSPEAREWGEDIYFIVQRAGFILVEAPEDES